MKFAANPPKLVFKFLIFFAALSSYSYDLIATDTTQSISHYNEKKTNNHWYDLKFNEVLKIIRKNNQNIFTSSMTLLTRKGNTEQFAAVTGSRNKTEKYVKTKSDFQGTETLFFRSLYFLFLEEKTNLSNKKRYKYFLKYLRAAIVSPYYQVNKFKKNPGTLVQSIQKLCFNFYMGTEIDDFLNQMSLFVSEAELLNKFKEQSDILVNQNSGSDIKPFNSFRSSSYLSLILAEIRKTERWYFNITENKSIFDIKVFEKIKNVLLGTLIWAPFDPTAMGNITYKKFDMTLRHRKDAMHFIRMASPTIGSNSDTIISPEFLGYLDYLKNHKKTHTYFNYQDNYKLKASSITNLSRLGKIMGIANETHRAKQLESLNYNNDYKDTIQVVTLAKNSNFYWQNGDQPNQADEFKNKFIRKIFHEERKGYFFPRNLLNNDFKNNIREILDSIHNLVFSNREKLSFEERQDFIEIAYYFISGLISKDSFSVNHTCKSGIDRAGGANALIYTATLIQYILENEDLTQEMHQEILLLIHKVPSQLLSDALFNKGREIKFERLDRFIQVTSRLVKFAFKEQEKFKELFLGSVYNKPETKNSGKKYVIEFSNLLPGQTRWESS